MTRAQRKWVRAREIHLDIDSGEFFVKVAFKKIDGGIGKATIPRSQMDDPRGAKTKLASLGADIPAEWIDDMKDVLSASDCKIVETTSICGWRDRMAYVLPDRVLGMQGRMRAAKPELRRTSCKGTSKAWKSGMRRPCSGSSYLTFTLALGFAGPLLRPLKFGEGVVFHLFGRSSTGKSLVTIAAQSVISPAGRDQLRTFDLTPRALEEDAAACNDALLVLDEAGRMEGTPSQRRKAFSTLAYKLGGGQGRKRSSKATSDEALRNVQYLIVGLTSGEEALEGLGAQERKGGEQVRLIGIPVPAPEDGGVFDLEPSAPARTELALKTEAVIDANFGHPFREFVSAFIADRNGKNAAETYAAAFVRRVQPADTPFGRRFARKFAVVYAAAMLSADYNLAPWTKKQAGNAIRKIYRQAWSEVRPVESEADNFMSWLKREGASDAAFPIVERGEKLTLKAGDRPTGIRRMLKGKRCLAVFRERFSHLIARSENEVLALLQARGVLLPGKEARVYVRQIRIKGMPTPRTDCLLFDFDRVMGSSDEVSRP